MPVAATRPVLIRHAAAATGGRLCGRSDVPMLPLDAQVAARVAAATGAVDHVVTSPALRCRQTAAALFPALPTTQDARLWEQDFGAEDGLFHADLPDLGVLPRTALAARRAPGGESHEDMVARAQPALQDAVTQAPGGSTVVVVAHAGTVRAGLALAIGSPAAALAFEVAPLSMTSLRWHADGWSVIATNSIA